MIPLKRGLTGITITWQQADPLIALRVRDAEGDIRIQQKLPAELVAVEQDQELNE